MKKLLLIALVAFGAWNYYQKQNTTLVAEPVAIPKVLPDYTAPINKARAVANASQFRCDGMPCERQFGK